MLTFLGVILGGGILTFIQFLISRNDGKKEQNNEILNEIKELRSSMREIKDTQDMHEAISARNHILRFNDELLNDVAHSHDYYMEIMDDIQKYNEYCDLHKDFKNGRTKTACEFITITYKRLREKGEFLIKGGEIHG